VAPSPATVDFVNSSDPWGTAYSAYYFWTVGDWVEGSRSTSLSSTTSVTIHIAVDNFLSCDNDDFRMLINGVEVGRFTILAGSATYDGSFSYGAITGPTYTLRYEVTRTVASGCGSLSFAPSGSSVTLNP
jgi:hypothetical protein